MLTDSLSNPGRLSIVKGSEHISQKHDASARRCRRAKSVSSYISKLKANHIQEGRIDRAICAGRGLRRYLFRRVSETFILRLQQNAQLLSVWLSSHGQVSHHSRWKIKLSREAPLRSKPID